MTPSRYLRHLRRESRGSRGRLVFFSACLAVGVAAVVAVAGLSSGIDRNIRREARQLLAETYGKLTPWQKTQVARHPERPHCLDYVGKLIEGFTPLAGDRYFAEDAVQGVDVLVEVERIK